MTKSNSELAQATIDNMSKEVRSAFCEAFEAGDMDKAGELAKLYALDAVEKQSRMADVLLRNPDKMAKFSGVVLDMVAQ